MKYFALLTLWLLTIPTFGQIVKLESFVYNGKTYHNVKLEKTSPVEVRLTHNDGVRKIPMSGLSEEQKNKLGFNKLETDTHINKIKVHNDQNEKFLPKLQTLYLIRGTVNQVTDEGIIINSATVFKFKEVGYFTYNTTDTSIIGFESLGHHDIFIYGKHGVVDNSVVSYFVEGGMDYSFITVLGATRTIRGVNRTSVEFNEWYNTVIAPKNNEIVNQRVKDKIRKAEAKLQQLELEEIKKREQRQRKQEAEQEYRRTHKNEFKHLNPKDRN